MRHFIAVVIAVCIYSVATAQDTISGPDGKVMGWYMSYWYDTCWQYYDTNANDPWYHDIPILTFFGQNSDYALKEVLAKGERVKYPAAIKGVSVWVKDWKDMGKDVIDSVRLPEYIYLYQKGEIGGAKDSMLLVDSVRWDTARYQIMKVPLHVDIDQYGFAYSQLYTAYFEQPVEVDSLFFLGETYHNSEIIDIFHYAHPPTVYNGVFSNHGFPTRCPFQYSTPVMKYYGWCGMWDNITINEFYQPWGLFMPLIDFVDLHVVSADSTMGTAGPYDTVSANTIQHIWAQPYSGYRFSY